MPRTKRWWKIFPRALSLLLKRLGRKEVDSYQAAWFRIMWDCERLTLNITMTEKRRKIRQAATTWSSQLAYLLQSQHTCGYMQ